VAVSNLLRLLDLPDEAIEMLEREELSEGHGRALLLAEDHGARRSLARDAAREGWSVRTAEARAREANSRGEAKSKKRRVTAKPVLHPDQEEAASTIATTLEEALGTEVRVSVEKGGYRAELSFASPREALDLAHRLGGPTPREELRLPADSH
jgi:ParB family chromosome partitioning protein